MTNKVVRDGKVAVLYSPGFGAGWSTWNSDQDCLFEPEIVAAVEAGEHGLAASIAKAKYGNSFYDGGAGQLEIEWLPVGTAFEIHEYDGSESVRVREDQDWITA